MNNTPLFITDEQGEKLVTGYTALKAKYPGEISPGKKVGQLVYFSTPDGDRLPGAILPPALADDMILIGCAGTLFVRPAGNTSGYWPASEEEFRADRVQLQVILPHLNLACCVECGSTNVSFLAKLKQDIETGEWVDAAEGELPVSGYCHGHCRCDVSFVYRLFRTGGYSAHIADSVEMSDLIYNPKFPIE